MRNVAWLWGQPVYSVGTPCGITVGLYAGVASVYSAPGYKYSSFYPHVPGFILVFIRSFFRQIQSVTLSVIPIIHSTYNKPRLVKVNNFVINRIAI